MVWRKAVSDFKAEQDYDDSLGNHSTDNNAFSTPFFPLPTLVYNDLWKARRFKNLRLYYIIILEKIYYINEFVAMLLTAYNTNCIRTT